jgi:hypothetical protein
VTKDTKPRFGISAVPADSPSVLDDLLSVPRQTPPQPPTEGEPLTGTVVSKFVNDAPAAVTDAFVSKFVNGDVPTLDECEQHISRVTTQYLIGVGRALAAIRDHQLYKQRGYTSFGDYLAAEQPWKPPYVSRIISALPVVEALARHGAERDVNEAQATALRPVLETHGEDALFEVWDATVGKRSAAALVRVARARGYLPPVDDTDQPAQPAALARVSAALRQMSLPLMRSIALQYPEVAADVADRLEEIAREIRADLTPSDE